MSFVEYRRTLPHLQPESTPVFVTWRLWASVAGARRDKLLITEVSPGQTFAAKDRILDGASGAKWLRDPKIAAFVADQIRIGPERGYYALHAWVIMPNHVHILITPNLPLARITQGLKGSTARHANRILGLTGSPFWRDESWDHWVRNESEMRRIVRYIEMNPVTASLVSDPEQWPYSSAIWKA